MSRQRERMDWCIMFGKRRIVIRNSGQLNLRGQPMLQSHTNDENTVLAAWQEQIVRASKHPWLLQLILGQWQRVLRRLAYFYAQLASLPRRNRRALQRALAPSLIGAA